MIIKAGDSFKPKYTYIVLGIDAEENDRVIDVFDEFWKAKEFCRKVLFMTEFYDVWIQKHEYNSDYDTPKSKKISSKGVLEK